MIINKDAIERKLRDLIKTIADKDKQIQDMQERLDKCEKVMKGVLDNLYCMLPCGSAKDTQYGHIAVDSLEKALEVMESTNAK